MSYGASLLQALIALVAVCVLAYAVLRVGRRGLVGRRHTKLIERVPLDPRTTLYVVEVGGKTLLLGSGGGALSTLAEIDPDKLTREEPQPRPSFADVLSRIRRAP